MRKCAPGCALNFISAALFPPGHCQLRGRSSIFRNTGDLLDVLERRSAYRFAERAGATTAEITNLGRSAGVDQQRIEAPLPAAQTVRQHLISLRVLASFFVKIG